MNFIKKNWRVYDVMPRAFFSDSFNDIHELKYGQAEEKLEAAPNFAIIDHTPHCRKQACRNARHFFVA